MTQNTQVPQYGYGAPNTNTGFTIGMQTSDFYDRRSGLTSADSSANVMCIGTVSGAVYEASFNISGDVATISAGTYVVGWTHLGVAQTATVSISAVSKNSTAFATIPLDVGATITTELTTLTVTGSGAVSVCAVFTRVL